MDSELTLTINTPLRMCCGRIPSECDCKGPPNGSGTRAARAETDDGPDATLGKLAQLIAKQLAHNPNGEQQTMTKNETSEESIEMVPIIVNGEVNGYRPRQGNPKKTPRPSPTQPAPNAKAGTGSGVEYVPIIINAQVRGYRPQGEVESTPLPPNAEQSDCGESVEIVANAEPGLLLPSLWTPES